MRLERFLRHEAQLSRRTLIRCKQSGSITCNGMPIRTIDPIHDGDVIVLEVPETSEGTVAPNPALCVPILYESTHLLVYQKPPYMPCHPSHGHYMDTLGNAFAARYPETPFRCINRLDRNTSGVCLVAKTAYGAHFVQGKTEKSYLAAVVGEIHHSGTVCAPIARQEDSVILRCVRADGKPAVTHFAPLMVRENQTLLRLVLETGRTHQIRVHMAQIGHPLIGDDLYGMPSEQIARHALHCKRISFPEPECDDVVTVTAPLPQDMQRIMKEYK
jgi:23S rRNA pseudouridine1911/1915/1917 synthase